VGDVVAPGEGLSVGGGVTDGLSDGDGDDASDGDGSTGVELPGLGSATPSPHVIRAPGVGGTTSPPRVTTPVPTSVETGVIMNRAIPLFASSGPEVPTRSASGLNALDVPCVSTSSRPVMSESPAFGCTGCVCSLTRPPTAS
jgi:hypothetical protein